MSKFSLTYCASVFKGSDQTPAADARDPVITVTVTDAITQEAIADATLTLTVDGAGYFVGDGALAAQP